MGTTSTLSRVEVKGAFFSFIPVGTNILGTPVAKDSWPSSSAAYLDWRFKDTETLKRERKVDSRTRNIPLESGGYEEQNRKSLKGMAFIGTTAQTNGVLKQLENGLPEIAVAGVAQEPMTSREASIEGVSLIELVDEDTGLVVDAWQFWSRLSLDTPSDASPETSTLTWRSELIKAGLNTYEPN